MEQDNDKPLQVVPEALAVTWDSAPLTWHHSCLRVRLSEVAACWFEA